MAQMVVRNIPEGVMEELKAQARAEHVSVEEVARRTLAEAATSGRRWREFVEWAERHLVTQRPARRGTGARLIRQDRAR